MIARVDQFDANSKPLGAEASALGRGLLRDLSPLSYSRGIATRPVGLANLQIFAEGLSHHTLNGSQDYVFTSIHARISISERRALFAEATIRKASSPESPDERLGR
jgi:hypothetical protein